MSTIIQSTLKDVLRVQGFKKDRTTWRKECPESTLVLNLQKSQYGDLYYVNLGIWLKPIGGSHAPKEYQCHIRARLESISRLPLAEALDMEKPGLGDEERADLIRRAVESEALPWLEASSSVAGAREQLEGGRLQGAPVMGLAREFLTP